MRALIPFLSLLAATPAAAEVKSATPAGFELESRVTVPVPPTRAYAALAQVGSWWADSHTYSGEAANMIMELRAGACFCEAIPADGGSIEHGRVIYARPGQQLRVSGALGPLQAEAAVGTLTWTFRPSGNGTEIVMTYVVGGYIRGPGAQGVAPLVDRVMTEQLEGLRTYLSR